MIDRQLVAGRLGKLLRAARSCARGRRAQRFQQRRHGHVGLAVDEDIDRRQALIVHAPAIVQVMIDRHLNDLGGDIADGLERARQVEPVEAEDDVGCADCIRRLGREHRATGRAGMEIM